MQSGDSFFGVNRPFDYIDSLAADPSQYCKDRSSSVEESLGAHLNKDSSSSSRRKHKTSNDSVSTLGNLSAAEVVRQNHAKQKLHSKKQRQHEQYWKPAVYTTTPQKQRSSRTMNTDEASVASTIVRALAQGASRAEHEPTERARPVVKPRGRAPIWDSPLTQDEGPGSGLRALLIQYLISIGTSLKVVEQIADQFIDQEDGGGSVFDSPLTTDGAPGGIRTLLIPYLISLGHAPVVAERMFDELSDQHFGGAAGAATRRNKEPSNTPRAPVYDSPLTALDEDPGDLRTLMVEYMVSLGTNREVAQRMMGHFSEHSVRRTATSSSQARQTMPVDVSPLTTDEDPVRATMIQYIISVGADPKVAEKMADLFTDQPNGNVGQRLHPSAFASTNIPSSAPARPSDAMSTRQHPMDSRNQGHPVIVSQVNKNSPMSQSKQSVQQSVSSSTQQRPSPMSQSKQSVQSSPMSQSKPSVQHFVSTSSQRRPTSNMEGRLSTSSHSKLSVQHSLSSSSIRRPASATHHQPDADNHAGTHGMHQNLQQASRGFDIQADMTLAGESFIEVSHTAPVKDPYNNDWGVGSMDMKPIATGASAHKIDRDGRPRRGLMALICCRQENQGD